MGNRSFPSCKDTRYSSVHFTGVNVIIVSFKFPLFMNVLALKPEYQFSSCQSAYFESENVCV